MTCEKCGAELRVGTYPFCPHGTFRGASHGDDIPGGMWVENGFKEPVKVYSHSEHERKLAETGHMLAPHWVPNDKHLTKWDAAIDPKTLENVKVLLSRQGKAQKEDVPAAPPALIQALKDRLYR